MVVVVVCHVVECAIEDALGGLHNVFMFIERSSRLRSSRPLVDAILVNSATKMGEKLRKTHHIHKLLYLAIHAGLWW